MFRRNKHNEPDEASAVMEVKKLKGALEMGNLSENLLKERVKNLEAKLQSATRVLCDSCVHSIPYQYRHDNIYTGSFDSAGQICALKANNICADFESKPKEK